jgi:hypothetical protein
MSITHSEFLRSLQPLKRYYSLREEDQGRRIVIEAETLSVEIVLGVEGVLTLGSLSVPSSKVDFIFHPSSSDEKAQFLARFDLCFRRGGG